MISNNPATALDRILRLVVESGEGTISQGWAAALGASPGEVEFVQRHSEVVGLLSRVHAYLTSLPEGEPERNLYLKYLPLWCEAVVDRRNWNHTNNAPDSMIGPEVLDHLSGLGANLKRRAADIPLPDVKVQKLFESLERFRELLNEADFPPDLAQQIRAQVEHIQWLMANVGTFGAEAVENSARTLIGISVPLIGLGGGWARRATLAMAGLVLFLAPLDQATGHAASILGNLSAAMGSITNFGEVEPQKAITAGTEDVEATAEEGD